jgi:hypothetical protein
MADDFGDDAGQQIFDWALRLGLEGYRRGGGPAGQRAVEEAIGRLEAALESARDAVGASPALRPLPGADEVAELRLALSRHDDGDHVVAYRVHVAVVREVEQARAPHRRELGHADAELGHPAEPSSYAEMTATSTVSSPFVATIGASSQS